MATAKSKTDLITDADSFLPDNITEDISPGDVRDRVKDLASSMLNIIDGGFVVTQLTGYASALTPTDDKHFANKKYVDDAIAGLSTGLTYLGTWDASTNTPTIVSSTGNNGEYYIVNVDGSTNIDGITDWKIGDWIIFNGGTWQKIDQSIDFADGYPLYDARYAKLDGTNSPFTGDVTFNEDIIINTQGSFNRQFRFQNGATILVSANIFGTEYSHGARLSTYNIFSTSEIRLRRQNSSGGWINTPFVFDLTNSQFTASGAAGTKNGIITDGSIKVANNSQTAAAAGAGSIKYDSGIQISDASNWEKAITSPLSNTKVTAGAPYTNDGYIEVRINGTLVKLMTTA